MENLAMVVLSTVLCMALAIHAESRGEPYEGKVAVASVIMNRANSNGTDTCAEITKPYQFPWAKQKIRKVKDDYILQTALPKDSTWEPIIELAEQVMDGRKEVIKGIMSFHNIFEQPKWKLKYARRIGNHHFYFG
jgi:hypothetical protein